jgi:dolichol-phosphate mannosyltransferase
MLLHNSCENVNADMQVGTLAGGPELTIVAPSRPRAKAPFKERENVAVLPERLHAVLAGVDWEIIYVDDSPDSTAERQRVIAMSNP